LVKKEIVFLISSELGMEIHNKSITKNNQKQYQSYTLNIEVFLLL